MIELVDLNALRPSAYNPRTADEKRLALVELSLKKLGWLLPIYADAAGEIVSGHQRHLIARRMNLRKVPVCRLASTDLSSRKALNIAFNRGTNDLFAWDTPADLTERLLASTVERQAKRLKDLPTDTEKFYPCMMQKAVPLAGLLKKNSGRWIQYARNIARTLAGKGVIMPLVCRPDLTVINGIGRLQMLAEMRRPTAQVVFVPDSRAKFAAAALNLLSMDFDLHRRYADLLRYNSFRRARRVRENLGRGFVFAAIGGKAANRFDIFREADRREWRRVHGLKILDFGAGHYHETNLLRKAGFEVTPFEPYRIGASEEIDKAASVESARNFLAEVAAGRRWDSLFVSSVLNSVPFESDRLAIVAILAAVCEPPARLYATASADDQSGWESVSGREYVNRTHYTNVTFVLGYEPGIQLGELGDKPKVQKYHSPAEFARLFRQSFADVKVNKYGGNVHAICRRPRPVDLSRLEKALRFEFDLPYPDGSRMNLFRQAIAAFRKRLGGRP